VSHPLIIRPEAEDDLAEARDWYDAQRDGLGLEFLAAVEDVFDRVRATPELYAGEYKGIRRTVTNRFPYVVYYRLLVESVEVIAVLHGSRSSRLWRGRA
jgi:plasmid stabilization system protein ParE